MRIAIIMWFVTLLMSSHTEIHAQASAEKDIHSSKMVEEIPSLSFTSYPANWQRSYSVSCKKAKECSRKAKRFAKKKEFINAMGYAAKTLRYEPRKKTEKKALALLTSSNLALAQKEYEEQINAFPDIEYTDWSSSKALYNRMWVMQKYNLVSHMLQSLQHPKVKLDAKPIDSNVLGNLASKLLEFRARSAKEYYAGGLYYLKLGHKNKDKMDYKRAALSFWIANQYVNDFKDATAQYESAKKLATSTVYISSHYETSGGFARILDEDVKAALQQIRGFSGLRFVEISSSKSTDYHVKLVANGLELVTRGKTSDKQEFSKEVKDANDKVVTKKATVTTYTSGYNARAKINVDVIDRKTNNVIYSTVSERTYNWVTVWQKGAGDLNIVKSKYKRYVGNSPDRAPARKTLYERAISMCASDIASKLYTNFLRRTGSSPAN